MTNHHIEAVKRLARAVADKTASDVVFGVFRVYLFAAGATQSGSWVYVPGRATPLKGWRAVGEYIALLPDTSGFLRAFANVLALAEREQRPPELTHGRIPVTPDALGVMSAHVSMLAEQIAGLAVAPVAPYDPEAVYFGDEVTLDTLTEAQTEIVGRVARRAGYDALRGMLDVLDGWVEGAADNHEALGHRDSFQSCCAAFYAEDVRRMINDRAREIGAPEPWRAP